MARVNVDDTLFKDERFRFISRKIGDKLALGDWLTIVVTAQKYWVDNKLIPKNIWAIGEHDESFVSSGLVVERDDGFYLCGSEEQFAWILSCRENGKKGGRRKKEPKKNPQVSDGLAGGKPLTLTLTPTPTLYIHTDTVGNITDDDITASFYANQKTPVSKKQPSSTQDTSVHDLIIQLYTEKELTLRPSTLASYRNKIDSCADRTGYSIDDILQAVVNYNTFFVGGRSPFAKQAFTKFMAERDLSLLLEDFDPERNKTDEEREEEQNKKDIKEAAELTADYNDLHK